MSESQKKRHDLNLSEKMDILDRYDKLPKMSQRNAAARLHISQPLLCKLLKNRNAILTAGKQNDNLQSKRNRGGKDSQVEAALKLWFLNVREKDVQVDGRLMRQKAEDLAKKMGKSSFVATGSWFNRWKKRENIVLYKRTDEKEDAKFFQADNWMNNVWPKITSEYSACDIYTAQETGIYYRALPPHTSLFKQDSEGYKLYKERITVLCCVSMSGGTEELLVVGKTKSPRCFKVVKNLPVEYYSNSKAWMTSLIFNEWLIKWDNSLDHRIVLLVNSCAAHRVNVSLKNIKVIYLPAVTLSFVPPCDQGIIWTLKAYYRREMRSRILDNMEEIQAKPITANGLAKRTTLIDALHLLAMSWNRVTPATIQNCFMRSGFVTDVTEEYFENSVRPLDISEDEFEEWMAIDEKITVTTKLTEEDVCEAVVSTSKATENGGEDGDEIKDEVEDVDEIKDEVEDVDEEILPTRTNKEVRQALEILRQYVQQTGEDFQKHYEYEQYVDNLLRKDN